MEEQEEAQRSRHEFFFPPGHLQGGDPFGIQTNQSLFSTSFSHSACVERLQQMVQGIVG